MRKEQGLLARGSRWDGLAPGPAPCMPSFLRGGVQDVDRLDPPCTPCWDLGLMLLIVLKSKCKVSAELGGGWAEADMLHFPGHGEGEVLSRHLFLWP